MGFQFTKVLLVLTALTSLAMLAAADDCAIYDAADEANQSNHWYAEDKLVWDSSTSMHSLQKTYHGVDYAFQFRAGVREDPMKVNKDALRVKAYRDGPRPQFKVKVKNRQGYLLRSYWSADGADCQSKAAWIEADVGEVVVSERCYSNCSRDLEHP